MYLGCSSESYSQALGAGRLTLPDFIRICSAELGLAAVELEDAHIGEPAPARLAELRTAAERHGVEIVSIALMNNFGVADDAKRRAEEARTVQWMAASRELQTRFLRTFAGWPEGERIARWPVMLAALRTVATAAEKAQVQLVMENHNHGGFVQTADDVLAVLNAVASPALALLLDTGNYVDGLHSIRRTARLARHVHAKFRRVGVDGRDRLVDHEAVIAELREVGYQGCLSVEYEGEEAPETAVPRAVAYLRRILAA
jgi:sugar phosphate isomerase/epimerase